MKSKVHPKYYENAVFSCACGSEFSTGATEEKVEVEICSSCHPLYTGKDTLIDTEGRAERFAVRRERAQAQTGRTKKREKQREKNKKQEQKVQL
jgi:large subunit ribosomal protein L31